MTLLAVPITVRSLDSAQALAVRAAEHGADVIEYRVDGWDDAERRPTLIAALIADAPRPVILTCRTADEGGASSLTDLERAELLEAVAAHDPPPAYVDFELLSYQRDAAARAAIERVAQRSGLILSTHDFTGRPVDLDRRIAAMADVPTCRIIKAAWRARSVRDNVECFELLSRRLKPTIALCMGEAGLPSRVLAGKFGGFLTFASLDDTQATAPGQPTLAQLKRLYRGDAVTESTRVYAVIGHPVTHSKSPAIHNAGFTATGFDGVYVPLPVDPTFEAFKAVMVTWLHTPGLHFRGASVTLPHKEHLLRFVRESGGGVEPLAEMIGAANTLVVGEDGGLSCFNSDYAAAIDAVAAALGVSREGLAGQRVAVLGAGGVSRALVAGFTDAGCAVTVFNRTAEKARLLADGFRAEAGTLADAADFTADVWLNGTSVGMHPDVEATPLPTPPASWNAGTVVFDTIYTPRRTRLLRDAEAAGCITVEGVTMFISQAAAQFEAWTALPAPTDVFAQYC